MYIILCVLHIKTTQALACLSHNLTPNSDPNHSPIYRVRLLQPLHNISHSFSLYVHAFLPVIQVRHPPVWRNCVLLWQLQCQEHLYRCWHATKSGAPCYPSRDKSNIIAVRKVGHLNIKTKIFDFDERVLIGWQARLFDNKPIRTRASKSNIFVLC